MSISLGISIAYVIFSLLALAGGIALLYRIAREIRKGKLR